MFFQFLFDKQNINATIWLLNSFALLTGFAAKFSHQPKYPARHLLKLNLCAHQIANNKKIALLGFLRWGDEQRKRRKKRAFKLLVNRLQNSFFFFFRHRHRHHHQWKQQIWQQKRMSIMQFGRKKNCFLLTFWLYVKVLKMVCQSCYCNHTYQNNRSSSYQQWSAVSNKSTTTFFHSFIQTANLCSNIFTYSSALYLSLFFHSLSLLNYFQWFISLGLQSLKLAA